MIFDAFMFVLLSYAFHQSLPSQIYWGFVFLLCCANSIELRIPFVLSMFPSHDCLMPLYLYWSIASSQIAPIIDHSHTPLTLLLLLLVSICLLLFI